MTLLAVQFGMQPILTKTFATKEVCRSTVIMVQEAIKFCIALCMLQVSNPGGLAAATRGEFVEMGEQKRSSRDMNDPCTDHDESFLRSMNLIVTIRMHEQNNSQRSSLFIFLHNNNINNNNNNDDDMSCTDWTVTTWLSVACIPAGLYAVQNLAALQAYQNLDALTYNVLNQTKTLSAALCCYLVMGRTQSRMQVVALFILLLSALVMERIVTIDKLLQTVQSALSVLLQQSTQNDTDDNTAIDDNDNASTPASNSNDSDGNYSVHLTQGVAPILLASFISGLAGALSQKNLQGTGGRNPYLFSMELCAASSIVLLLSLTVSSDGQLIRENGFWHGWTLSTLIPIVTNSIGGIIVGLVTKYAGSVRKGFALIFGIFLSGLIQAPGTGVTTEQLMGGALAAVSLWMHATNPPVSIMSSSSSSGKSAIQKKKD